MNLNGAAVQHKKYGQGVVQEVKDKNIIINFNGEIKKFSYPDAFKLSLKSINEDMEIFINNELEEAEKSNEPVKAIESKTIKETTPYITMNCEFLKDESLRYFFVFQNKTFHAERRGGYIWAPKSSSSRTIAHWERMKEVRKGDVILHSLNKNIVAISIAVSDCYSANQPNELKSEQLWEDDGYMVDCKYIDIKNPIMTSDYKDEILKLQPSKYAPFNNLGRGNTGYLFASNKDLTEFIIQKSMYSNQYLNDVLGGNYK